MPQHIINVCCAAPAGSTKHRCLGHATGSSCLIPAPSPAEALGPVRGGGDRPREGQDPGQGGRPPKSSAQAPSESVGLGTESKQNKSNRKDWL